MTNVKALRDDGYEQRLLTLRDAVREAWPQGLNVQILGRSVGVAEIDQQLSSAIALFQDAHDAELALKQKRLLRDAALPAVHTFTRALERGLGAWFAVGDPERVRFGLSLEVRRPLTGVEKVIAHSRSLATRKLRFTMGPKQRAALGPQSTVQILGPDGKVMQAGDAAAVEAPKILRP